MTRRIVPNLCPAGAGRRHLRRRDAVQRMVRLARHLPAPDRLIVRAVYAHGQSTTTVARLTNTEHRKMQRKISRLTRRLSHPLFRFVAHRQLLLPRASRAVARHVVLRGRTLRDTATATGLTLHQVRKHLQILDVLARLEPPETDDEADGDGSMNNEPNAGDRDWGQVVGGEA